MNDIKVLIIDDDEQSCSKLKKHLMLKQNIREVDCAHCVKEAQQYISLTNYDVIALDIIMPDYDGFYLMEHMPIKNDTSIIVMSACSEESIIKKAFSLGAKYYMVKPYDCEVFYKRIIDVLKYEENVLEGIFYENKKEQAMI